jgi:hypothetical protein
VKEEEEEIVLLIAIKETLKDSPFYGYRKVYQKVKGLGVTEKQVRRVMKRAGLRGITTNA